MSKVFVVVAHPDDEIIGLGGTLRKHIKQKDQVCVLILGDGKTSRKEKYHPLSDIEKAKSNQETSKALKILGINEYYKGFLPDNRFDSVCQLDVIKIISKHIESYQPELIYTHHFGDANVDHQITSKALLISARPTQSKFISEVRMFETLSSTEVMNSIPTNTFYPNLFINIENELEDKIKALKCYASELQTFPSPRSIEAITYNAYLWGAKNCQPATEAFFIFRKCIK